MRMSLEEWTVANCLATTEGQMAITGVPVSGGSKLGVEQAACESIQSVLDQTLGSAAHVEEMLDVIAGRMLGVGVEPTNVGAPVVMDIRSQANALRVKVSCAAEKARQILEAL